MQRQTVAKACAVVAGLVVGGGLAVARPAAAPPMPIAKLEPRPTRVVKPRPNPASNAPSNEALSGIARLQALEAKLDSKSEEPEVDEGHSGLTPEERAVMAQGTPDWTKAYALPDLPVDYNPLVQQQVASLTSDPKLRKRVEAALKASGRYSHLVLQILRENALPEDLVSVVFASSGFQVDAVSARGDAGLWQLSPTEAVLYGLMVKPNYDERRDVELATRAVAKRLADLHEKYGTWELALAAFHSGDATISRVPDVGEKSFWELLSSDGELPKSAAEYVPLVLATALVLKNRDSFQLDTKPDAPIYPARMQVPAGMDLSLVARASGTSLDQIRMLNPSILSEFVPSVTRDLTIQVPSGSAGRARMLLAQVMSGYGSDDLHRHVPSSFDWGRDELPSAPTEFAPQLSAAKRNKARDKDPWLLPALVPPPGQAADVSKAPTPAEPNAKATDSSAQSDGTKSAKKPAKKSDWAAVAAGKSAASGSGKTQ
ncbi:MAG: lytic transglycosylase domain-containing protein [Polyangiaceae bacterium]|nr:lytic transglycosylase domain-containing protein [Polyangiaceae bacterium]